MRSANAYRPSVRLVSNPEGGHFKEVAILSDCLNLNCLDPHCGGCKPITQTAAKKLVQAELEKRKATFAKLTSRIDQNRVHQLETVVVEVHGYEPPADQGRLTRWNKGAFEELFEFGKSHGFMLDPVPAGAK